MVERSAISMGTTKNGTGSSFQLVHRCRLKTSTTVLMSVGICIVLTIHMARDVGDISYNALQLR